MVASIHLNINYNCNRYFWEFCYLLFVIQSHRDQVDDSEFRWGRYFSRIIIIIDKLLNVLFPAEGREKRVLVDTPTKEERRSLLINQCHRIIINKLDLTRSKKKKSKKKKEKKLKSLTLSNDSFNYGERENNNIPCRETKKFSFYRSRNERKKAIHIYNIIIFYKRNIRYVTGE